MKHLKNKYNPEPKGIGARNRKNQDEKSMNTYAGALTLTKPLPTFSRKSETLLQPC